MCVCVCIGEASTRRSILLDKAYCYSYVDEVYRELHYRWLHLYYGAIGILRQPRDLPIFLAYLESLHSTTHIFFIIFFIFNNIFTRVLECFTHRLDLSFCLWRDSDLSVPQQIFQYQYLFSPALTRHAWTSVRQAILY